MENRLIILKNGAIRKETKKFANMNTHTHSKKRSLKLIRKSVSSREATSHTGLIPKHNTGNLLTVRNHTTSHIPKALVSFYSLA